MLASDWATPPSCVLTGLDPGSAMTGQARFYNVVFLNYDRAGLVKGHHLLGLCELAKHHVNVCSPGHVFYKFQQDS